MGCEQAMTRRQSAAGGQHCAPHGPGILPGGTAVPLASSAETDPGRFS
ncbi:hypothetical protein SAMN04487983_1001188 [Streptomyces sp. yr375]|nr:hypothetical protein SAMN04487983_1001188 [Streptomyces sp. yr375]